MTNMHIQKKIPSETNLPLSTAKASISSKKTTDGAAALAFRKTSRTAFSLSPTHLLNNSGPYKKKEKRNRKAGFNYSKKIFIFI